MLATLNARAIVKETSEVSTLASSGKKPALWGDAELASPRIAQRGVQIHTSTTTDTRLNFGGASVDVSLSPDTFVSQLTHLNLPSHRH